MPTPPMLIRHGQKLRRHPRRKPQQENKDRGEGENVDEKLAEDKGGKETNLVMRMM